MDIPYFLGLSLAYDAWLRSGVSGNARNATLLYSSGTHDYADTSNRYSVRPALYSTVINLKKPWISRTFGSIARMYDAWVRSGVFFDSGAVYCLDSADGGYFGTLDRYAVRPALYSTVIN